MKINNLALALWLICFPFTIKFGILGLSANKVYHPYIIVFFLLFWFYFGLVFFDYPGKHEKAITKEIEKKRSYILQKEKGMSSFG